MESRSWLELPPEIMATILKKVGAVDILVSAENVCSSWRKICKDPLMWRIIDTHGFGDSDRSFEVSCRRAVDRSCGQLVDVNINIDHSGSDELLEYDPHMWSVTDTQCFGDSYRSFEVLCRRAVDRSCGQLVDINIDHFGSDELLEYISRSSNQLRRLGILSCHEISDEGLTEAVSKFPLLEHLEIFDCYFETESLEVVGKCCPLLKSLKLNKTCWDGPRKVSDEEALAIARSMPRLQHLEIFANILTNEGLRAIVDGCPDLEFLDIRECLNLDLDGQLGQECARRIKNVLKGSEKYTSADHYDSCFRAYMEALPSDDEDLEYDYENGDLFYQNLYDFFHY